MDKSQMKFPIYWGIDTADPGPHLEKIGMCHSDQNIAEDSVPVLWDSEATVGELAVP